MAADSYTTLERIHQAAQAEFLEKGFQRASLRSIVKSVGMTTGAFYGYYKSKEALFEALVGSHYTYFLDRFKAASENLPSSLINCSRRPWRRFPGYACSICCIMPIAI